MSIYSGFATRELEHTYDRALYNMLYLLQLRLARFMKGDTEHHSLTEEKFEYLFTKLYRKIEGLEEVKHLPPSFSYAC